MIVQEQFERTDLLPTDLLVPHYLIHCCAYYHYGVNLISDSAFDRLSQRLSDEWTDVDSHHFNKHLIEFDALRTSGYYIQHTNRILQTTAGLIEKFGLTSTPMPINARTKGKKGEREIIDLLQPHINQVYAFFGKEPPELKRNQMQSHGGGYDIVGVEGFAFEVKRVEQDTDGSVARWWEQATKQAGPDEEPVLFHRLNRGAWKVRFLLPINPPSWPAKVATVTTDIDDFIYHLKAQLTLKLK